jgi:tryptophanyl-tRNA synthetase
LKKITLTGIKPTGPPHIGNYLWMIKPALELADNYQATWLALGLGQANVFFCESEIPEIFEFT